MDTRAPRLHTALYFGWLDVESKSDVGPIPVTPINRAVYEERQLPPDVTRTKDGVERPLRELDAKFNGYRFGYFDAEWCFVLVSVNDVRLEQPIAFDAQRYGKKGLGPEPVHLDDDAAAAILVDMIVANPRQRDELGELLRFLGNDDDGVTRGGNQ